MCLCDVIKVIYAREVSKRGLNMLFKNSIKNDFHTWNKRGSDGNVWVDAPVMEEINSERNKPAAATYFLQITDDLRTFMGDAKWPEELWWAFVSPEDLTYAQMLMLGELSWLLEKPIQWMWAYLEARGRTGNCMLTDYVNIYVTLDVSIKAKDETHRKMARETLRGMTECDLQEERYNPHALMKSGENRLLYHHLAAWYRVGEEPCELKELGIAIFGYESGYLAHKMLRLMVGVELARNRA
jgi:hypothetical protein